ncbi:hypothetical protein [Marinigracilibium pacificum]|uniref:YD repeat-containing protein n=1 Tax=Marinigracilibium pacificum TaxID=2729599 RepID=A0A848J0I7_9BACT|nr:hypothetical protein [Marinigracilibium pacificum]NMM49035.1 hypothetical protein [Marinigracilibium pacificum]
MRKAVLFIALVLFGFVSEIQAQHFVTSFGVSHEWGVPGRIARSVSYDFRGYNWVHTNRYMDRGHTFFTVVLEGRRGFFEVTYDDCGHIIRERRLRSNPMHGHHCGNHCGFHEAYYTRVYQPRHGYCCDSHYRSHPVHGKHPGKGHGHHKGHGHNKGHGHGHKGHGDKHYSKGHKSKGHDHRHEDVRYTRTGGGSRSGGSIYVGGQIYKSW